MPYGQNFNSECYRILKILSFYKKIWKRSRVKRREKCLDYRKTYKVCSDRINCIDFCINAQFLKKHKNVSIYSLIDKDQFNLSTWSKLELNYDFDEYNKIRKYCEDKHSKISCNEAFFSPGTRIDFKDDNILRLNLYYEVQTKIEEETSIYKLFLEMLNILCIIFGLNINLIFKAILINNLEYDEFYKKSLFYVFCIFGFSYHLFFMLNEVLNCELIQSEHYQLLDSIKMNNIIFCFQINRTRIDLNNKLTTKYSDKISDDLSMNSIFERIIYLDSGNEWIELDEKSNYSNKNFKISVFYFSDLKCFQFNQNIEYQLRQFDFRRNKKVLKVVFKEQFANNDDIEVFFLTKIRNTMQFSKMVFLDSDLNEYLIIQKISKIEHNDKFSKFRSFPSFFNGYSSESSNDVNYLSNMIQSFKTNFNLKTLSLPMETNSEIELEIDDGQLFEQYFLQIKNKTDNQLSNLNYKQKIAVNVINSDVNEESFSFSLIFFTKMLKVSNDDNNYSKLILNLMSLTSLWLNTGILDLLKYVHQIKRLFNNRFYLFLNVKSCLRRSLMIAGR